MIFIKKELMWFEFQLNSTWGRTFLLNELELSWKDLGMFVCQEVIWGGVAGKVVTRTARGVQGWDLCPTDSQSCQPGKPQGAASEMGHPTGHQLKRSEEGPGGCWGNPQLASSWEDEPWGCQAARSEDRMITSWNQHLPTGVLPASGAKASDCVGESECVTEDGWELSS